jgi:formate C-acetyltransferase
MSFLEACQFTAWQIVTFDMYNGAGAALGSIDVFLKHYYDNDKHAGLIDDEEAIFHLCCLFLKDNTYYQVGGSDKFGNDRTNELSFLLLEAMHRLKIPVSICVRVHDRLNPKLLERSVQMLFEDRMGQPNFLGDKGTNEGFMRMGYPLELAVDREKSGCHWNAIPGREYTLNDCVKINFAKVFEVALQEMLGNGSMAAPVPGTSMPVSFIAVPVSGIAAPVSSAAESGEAPRVSPSGQKSVDYLWQLFSRHLERAVLTTAKGLDFQMAHMHEVFPELVMDLLCYGPAERGLDATFGGVEFVNLCVDGAGLAVVADSFAALEQRVEQDKMLSWEDISLLLATDFAGAEVQRLMLKRVPRFGSGNSRADTYAVRIVRHFCDLVREKTTPDGFEMIPGLFSWANTIPMGKSVGATPNGRHAGAPISHGANPEPGFRESGAMTAMAVAVASVQCGYGNAVPIQLEVDPLEGASEAGRKTVEAFLRTYCNDLGGTLVNLNILDRETLLDAHRDPDKYPNLIVKVTGFSAYFATLSESFRQLVVDRLLTGL